MIDVLNDFREDVRILLVGVMTVMAIWFVMWTWVRTRSLVPTLGALIVGALVIYGVSSYTFLRDQVKEDVERYAEG